MTSKFVDETNQDFKEFMNAEIANPPQELQDQIFAFVYRDLNPSPWAIFSKLSLNHLVVGIVTLSLCPQFGVRLIGEGMGIMRFFLPFGSYGCTALCGAFFVGASLFASGIILRPEEIRVLRCHRFLQISALTLLSLGGLIMLEAEILFAFALAWMVGSILGGLTMLEVGRFVRLSSRQLRSF